MDGFLVVLRHSSDDFPMGLFANVLKAVEFASNLEPTLPETLQDLFNADGATPVSVYIAEFQNGAPFQFFRVRSLLETVTADVDSIIE